MRGFRPSFRAVTLVATAILIGVVGLYGLLKPTVNGCNMTYMHPTYIRISSSGVLPSAKYGLYLYHDGWEKIDHDEHLKKLSGVPVLFIPGNSGSYKQVRSIAAESEKAFQRGPLERTFYQEDYLASEEGGEDMDSDSYQLPNHYSSRLDWFTVDLEDEFSAMDGQILEDHAEYVVYAIHRILDQYIDSRDAREREGVATTGSLPKSVILVGHSMGGIVARAATIHPHLRKSAVATILTFSCPHQLPPMALGPSLGHFYESLNEEWRKGYEVQTFRTGHHASISALAHVVVVSISGGYNDYQVRLKLESLDGIVPPTHGFMISSTGMKNVWLSVEHPVILWCNQLVVQVSHTLLTLMDSRTGQPFNDARQRLAILATMLRGGVPQSFNSKMHSQSSWSMLIPVKDVKDSPGSRLYTLPGCPSNVIWNDNMIEKDLYIKSTTFTILAMDGRRRWLDIQNLSSNGKNHFNFVSNLAPCSSVRIHLWPQKERPNSDLPHERVVEVTSKMVQISAGPAPRQIKPGSQTEQAPPSAVFQLLPEEMKGFKFLTVSVAPRPTVPGGPPPASSMAVGQFYNPEEGNTELSPKSMLLSAFSYQDIFLEEHHPLAFKLTFAISLGLLPLTFSLKTAGCGIKKSELSAQEDDDTENSRLCNARCFPPGGLAWDPTSGLHVFPNFSSKVIIVDSSPALRGSTGSEKTTVLLLADPHCSYRIGIAITLPATAARFLLIYFSELAGFSLAVVFFGLMRQAYAQPVPSILKAIESNLRIPFPFLAFSIFPVLISLFLFYLRSQPFPPFFTITIISVICYLIANGSVIILVLISQLVFYVAAYLHISIKRREKLWQANFCFSFLHWFVDLCSSFSSLKMIRVLRANRLYVSMSTAIFLSAIVHPALGLFILLLSHVFCCHGLLCNSLAASSRTHARRKEPSEHKNGGSDRSQQFAPIPGSPSKQKSSSYEQSQEDTFHYLHGLLVLHLLGALMFVPSLLSWFQRKGWTSPSFPKFLDSSLCICLILHGMFSSETLVDSSSPSPRILGRKVRLSYIYVYLLAGLYSCISALALTPYKAFYAMGATGAFSFALSISQRLTRVPRFGERPRSLNR